MSLRRSTKHKIASSKSYIGGGVTEADFKIQQKATDRSFKAVLGRIERFKALKLYRERVSDQGIIIELERLRAAYKKHKRVSIKRAIEDLEFLTE